jgi:hypothetical protein
MTSQQKLIAWLATLLVFLVIYRVYKPYLSTIIFDTPSNTPSLAVTTLKTAGSLSGDAVKSIGGDLVGPNGALYGNGPASNPWAPF